MSEVREGFLVNFLRKKRGVKVSYFCFPQIKDKQVVIKADIIKKVRVRDIRRGRYVLIGNDKLSSCVE